jgi:RNA polymerase sigma-70 factor, ECF subfamily
MGLGIADSRRSADLSPDRSIPPSQPVISPEPVHSPAAATPNAADLEAARRHDAGAFERLIGPHRAELLAHCYRMVGSAADAEDALQETLLRAWRGLPSFEGRSSLRTWLYRIATNVCLKMIERRPKRVLPIDYGPASDPHDPPEGPLTEQVWLEPYPDDALGLEDGPASPEARYEERESVELAFVAALQHLPGRQRAVLLLRDVLGFAPAEIAAALDATPAAVYSALQRARQAVDEQRLPERSQQATLRSIGDERLREAVERYMDAWERNDVAAIAAMLTDDATFTMPPEPSWYVGRSAVAGFFASRPLSGRLQWRHVPVRANGQLAFGLYAATPEDNSYLPDAIMVLSLDSSARITSVTAFREPAAFARFGLPDQIAR